MPGGLNYYRAARMGDQVAAGGVPEEYEAKIRDAAPATCRPW